MFPHTALFPIEPLPNSFHVSRLVGVPNVVQLVDLVLTSAPLLVDDVRRLLLPDKHLQHVVLLDNIGVAVRQRVVAPVPFVENRRARAGRHDWKNRGE